MKELEKDLETTVETDQGPKQANIVDALFAIAESIDGLTQVILLHGDPDPDEGFVCPECQAAREHGEQ